LKISDFALDPALEPRMPAANGEVQAIAGSARLAVRPLAMPVPAPVPAPVAAPSAPAGIESAAAIRGLDEALLAYIKPEPRMFALLRDAPHKRLSRLASELSHFGEAGDVASRIILAQADAFGAMARSRAALVKG
jgi:hypothetical protein